MSTKPLTSYHRYLESLPLASREVKPSPDEVQLPPSLLAQLARPITNLDDAQFLALELQDARQRGCF
jgi:hypothetical protein